MRRLIRPVACGLVVTAVLVGLLSAGAFRAFRAQTADALFPLGDASSRVVVVGVDQRSIAETAQRWPWPRSLQAQLVAAIQKAEPAVVVLDVVYSPPSADDAAIGAAVSADNVVVAALADLGRGDGRLLRAREFTGPSSSVGTDLAVGHSAVTPDAIDGVTRVVPLVVEDDRRNFVPSLSLLAFAMLEGLPPTPTLRPRGVQVGDRYVPTESRAQLRIAYSEGLNAGRAREVTISAADVLAGKVPASAFVGKAVFVGVTDPASGDLHTTPTDKGAGAPGVFVHANALSTMLTRNYLALASSTETALWVLLLSVIVSVATWRFRVWLAAILAGSLSVGYAVMGFVRFNSGTAVDFVFPLLAVALCFALSLAARLVVEAAERRRVAGLLEQYVPSPIARHLLARGRAAGHPPTGTLTFLFTDVVGSTEAWETYPREMSDAMRTHDDLVDNAVEEAGGAVVRPRGEGDSRFCVFVAAIDAARAALAIDAALRRERWNTPEPLQVRMGIHTGEAELRAADYYGSSVNRCARIRGVARAGEIVLSSVTAELITDDLPADSLVDRGFHELKGMAEPEHVFQLVTNVTVSRI